MPDLFLFPVPPAEIFQLFDSTPWVMGKVVMEGIAAGLNILPVHNVFQIYGLPVTGAG